jgi:hypothetical protein
MWRSCETILNDGVGVTIRIKEGWQAGSRVPEPFSLSWHQVSL